MAGNRGIYNAAMKRAQAYAWKQEWGEALREYQRAAAEFPDDPDARLGIAAAYTGLARWTEALQVYEQLHREMPDDPVILERLADALVQLKDRTRARDAYLRLSDLYVFHQKVPQAIATLQRLCELFPQDEEVLARLARLYQESGDEESAAQAMVERVRLLFQEKRIAEAMALCEEALRLAPEHRQARELLFRLRREMAARKERGEEEEAGPAAPVSQYQLEEWVREATERQERGDLEGALRLYERAAQSGLRRADVCYSLAFLYKETGRLEESIEWFQAASKDDEYALSSHYALGEVYRDLGRLEPAAQEFERALHLVDLQTIGREAIEDLIQMYEAAATVHERLGDLARAASLYATLAGFLQGKRWRQQQVDEFRKRAQELTEKSMFAKLRQLGTGILPAIEEQARAPQAEAVERPAASTPAAGEAGLRPITDFLRPSAVSRAESTPSLRPLEEALSIAPPAPVHVPVRELDTSGLDEGVRELVEASRVYVERGLFYAAIDACCKVIERAPEYLPIHLRLAEIYERQDRPEMALAKYQALIQTYLARGEKEKAVDVYRALLSLSPDDLTSRSRLAELLLDLGREEEGVREMIQVAQTYFRLGQTTRAIESFREIRTRAPDSREVYLEYGLFLLKLDRPEAAVSELRRAVQMDPQDPVGLARINIALAWLRDEEPFWESLDALLKRAEEDEQACRTMEQEYKEALLIQEIPVLYYVLGLLQRQAGRVTEALESFHRASQRLGEEPKDVLQLRLCRAIAEAHLLLGQTEEAIRALEKGLQWAEALAPRVPAGPSAGPRAVPTALSFYHWLAEAYTKLGWFEQAVTTLNRAKVTHPHDRETITKLADLYFRQGNLRQALAELNGLATHYEQTNDLDRALEVLQQMVRLAPSNLTVRRRLATLSIRRGFVDRGLNELETVAELQQKRGMIEEAVRSLQQIAEIYWTMGRQDRAYQAYGRIVQLVPHDTAARQQLVNLHILAGRLADALEEQRTIARIALERKETETAIAALHQVLALNPEDRWALRELGDLLSAIGEHGQAMRLYRRLARLEPENAEVAARLQEEERRANPERSGE